MIGPQRYSVRAEPGRAAVLPGFGGAGVPREAVDGGDPLAPFAAVLVDLSLPADAAVLVLGGGGSGLAALADAAPGWRVTGIDPAARPVTTRPCEAAPRRVRQLQGHVDAAPGGPFDAAACLLALPLLGRDERVRTLRETRRRLRPGAPLVLACSRAQGGELVRVQWLERQLAEAIASGASPAQFVQGSAVLSASHALLAETDRACLREAGYGAVEPVVASGWQGWIAAA